MNNTTLNVMVLKGVGLMGVVIVTNLAMMQCTKTYMVRTGLAEMWQDAREEAEAESKTPAGIERARKSDAISQYHLDNLEESLDRLNKSQAKGACCSACFDNRDELNKNDTNGTLKCYKECDEAAGE